METDAEGKLNVIWLVVVEIVKSVPVVDEAKVKVLVVTPLMVEVTCGWVLAIVGVPVAELIEIPVPAARDWTPMLVIVFPTLFKPVEKVKALSLELNAVQSAEVNKPLAVLVAEGKLNVCVEPEDEIEKSAPEVDEANV